jgi:hypothetical protein
MVLADMIVPGFLLGVSLLSIFRPGVVVRWVKRSDPDIREDDGRALWTVRSIGIFGLTPVLTCVDVPRMAKPFAAVMRTDDVSSGTGRAAQRTGGTGSMGADALLDQAPGRFDRG